MARAAASCYRFAGALKPSAGTLAGELGRWSRDANTNQEIPMATQNTYSHRTALPGQAPTHATSEHGVSTLERFCERRTARRRRRLVTPRKRRVIARWLRRTADHAQEPHPLVRRRQALLHYRVAAVRTDLLEIAAMLEHAQDPDPARVEALRDLLANGCDSPLYNADIHVSELCATLAYVRCGLATHYYDQPHGNSNPGQPMTSLHSLKQKEEP
jgi:hypothetical protein